jgi:hypothetical protein
MVQRMSAKIYIRTRTVINTDPQRRCYNGCNFSERIEFGEWHLFQEWDSHEFAELVAKGLRCERQEVKVEDSAE